ncbi:MAG: hypothetical protein AB8G11_12400, partial [Saprospiraceae bacterium]
VIGYTILLLIFLLYWFTVIIGVLDIGSFDFDVDVDADVDVDVDIDADTDVDVEGGGGIVLAILGFFNFGKIPFMVLMSILSLSLWAIGILGNFYWGNSSIGFSIAFFPINLFISLVIAKIVTTPLIPVFKAFNDQLKPMRYVGMLAKVITSTSANNFGKVELWENNSFLTLKVKAEPNFEGVIKSGTEVVITGSNEIETIFFVRPTTF